MPNDITLTMTADQADMLAALLDNGGPLGQEISALLLAGLAGRSRALGLAAVAARDPALQPGNLDPMKLLRFDTSAFFDAHGHAPRGRGSWGFVFGKRDYDDPSEAWFAPRALTFGEAKKLAAVEARARGATLVGVCS